MPRAKPPPAALHDSAEAVERRFYEALQQADLALLMSLWGTDEDVCCVHPGGARVVGPAAIRETFRQIFERGAIPAQPEQVRRVQGPDCAVHHLVERIEVPSPEGVQTGYVLATNVYLRTAEGWRIVLHHASPALPSEPVTVGEAPAVLH
jgi:uncharacterized protein (TIGR02246 family)